MVQRILQAKFSIPANLPISPECLDLMQKVRHASKNRPNPRYYFYGGGQGAGTSAKQRRSTLL